MNLDDLEVVSLPSQRASTERSSTLGKMIPTSEKKSSNDGHLKQPSRKRPDKSPATENVI